MNCSANFPRVWPATPRSNASRALASGTVSAMTGRIAPESINAAISPSCSRLGSTMKNSPRLLNRKGSDPAHTRRELARLYPTEQDQEAHRPPPPSLSSDYANLQGAKRVEGFHSAPMCPAHIRAQQCPPSAPDRRFAMPLPHNPRGQTASRLPPWLHLAAVRTRPSHRPAGGGSPAFPPPG